MGSTIFDILTLTLEFDIFIENINLAYIFWTVSARALIFHMSILSDKTFPWVATFFTLLPWPWSWPIYEKTLTLVTVEQWVLELWYFIWVLVTRPFLGYQLFYPMALTLDVSGWNLTFQSTEWWLNGNGKRGFQSHFSHHSVTIQSTEWQAHFSDLSVNSFFEN